MSVSRWGGDPLAVAALALTVWCYGRGVTGIWGQVGRGRVVAGWQVWAFLSGIVVCLVALASPVAVAAGERFSAHMAQHTLLTVVAAPLLVLGAPVLPLLQGLPHRLRRRTARLHARAGRWRRMTGSAGFAFAAVLTYGTVVWLWHLPALYEAALRNDLVHAAEHVTLLGSALLLWWVVVASGVRQEFGAGTGIAVVFGAALLHGGLGALLTFAPAPLYGPYVASAGALGVDPFADQHLAGVLMWGPAKAVHGLAVVVLVISWLTAVSRRHTPTMTPTRTDG